MEEDSSGVEEGANINNIAPLRQPLEQRKNGLSFPPWFVDLVKTSNVAGDIEGWNHYEILRNDGRAADKVSKLLMLCHEIMRNDRLYIHQHL